MMPVRYRLIGAFLFVNLLILTACGGKPTADASPTLDPASDAGRGAALFRTHCATCHAVEGQRAVIGPSLEGIAGRAAGRVEGLSARDYLYDSILDPEAYRVEGFASVAMQQNFATILSSEELDYLVAYLLTLE